MDKLLFWLGIGAAQQSARSRSIDSRNWVVSLVVGTLVAALIGVVQLENEQCYVVGRHQGE